MGEPGGEINRFVGRVDSPLVRSEDQFFYYTQRFPEVPTNQLVAETKTSPAVALISRIIKKAGERHPTITQYVAFGNHAFIIGNTGQLDTFRDATAKNLTLNGRKNPIVQDVTLMNPQEAYCYIDETGNLIFEGYPFGYTLINNYGTKFDKHGVSKGRELAQLEKEQSSFHVIGDSDERVEAKIGFKNANGEQVHYDILWAPTIESLLPALERFDQAKAQQN